MAAEDTPTHNVQAEMFDAHGHHRQMVLFTEHRNTLNYSWIH